MYVLTNNIPPGYPEYYKIIEATMQASEYTQLNTTVSHCVKCSFNNPLWFRIASALNKHLQFPISPVFVCQKDK